MENKHIICHLCDEEIKTRSELAVAMPLGILPVFRAYHKECQDKLNFFTILDTKKNKDKLWEGYLYGSGINRINANRNFRTIAGPILILLSGYFFYRYLSLPPITIGNTIVRSLYFQVLVIPLILSCLGLSMIIIRIISYFAFEKKIAKE